MSSRHLFAKASLMVVCLSAGLLQHASAAVVALDPVSNPTFTATFDSVPADFIATAGLNDGNGNSDSWSVSGGMWHHSISTNGSSSNGSTQAVQTSGVSGTSFTVSSAFTIDARNVAGSNWRIVFPLLSKNPTQTYWSSDTFYNVVLDLASGWSGGADRLHIDSSDIGGDWNPLVLDSADLSSNLAVAGQYNVSIAGTYGAGGLTLSAVVKQGATELASAETTLATYMSGNYFGLHENLGYGSSGSASYDSYTLSVAAVPEPTSLALLGLGAISLLNRRRGA